MYFGSEPAGKQRHQGWLCIRRGSDRSSPKLVATECPSYGLCSVGRPKHVKVMAGGLSGDKFVGNEALENRGLLRLQHPMAAGQISNWDDMECVWSHLYQAELKADPAQFPVLMTEAPLGPRRQRERTAQILFETFGVPSLFLSVPAILSLYASGRMDGIVVDAGDTCSYALPIVQGFSVANALKRSDVGGRAVTEHFCNLLRKAGLALATSAERELAREVKEKHCYLAMNPFREEKESFGKQVQIQLPDGRQLRLAQERFRAPEILFQPLIVGSECSGIDMLVNDALNAVDTDLRSRLLESVLLSGGSTLTKGFGDRLLYDLKRAHKNAKLRIYSPAERKYSAWIGGSILASLGSFRRMWVSNAEYAEDPEVIHRKTF